MSPKRLSLLVFAALVALLALHAWHYWPFVADDALISLRYSMRFAHGQGLTWTDGERVEGYTNFLWVVLNAIVGLVIGFIPSARVLGFAGVLLFIASIALEPRGRGLSLPRLLVGGALVVATAPFAIWAIGGLEQGLLTGLLALSLRLLERSAYASDVRRAWQAGIPLALVALLRADGALLVIVLVAAAACLPRPSLASAKRAALSGVPAAIAVGAQLAFRLSYYGDWLPNTARVKVAFTAERALGGFAYVGGAFGSAGMLVLLAVVASVFAFRRGERAALVMPWTVVVTWSLYIAVVGGDIFPGFRQFIPVLVALCILVADEVAADWNRILSQRVIVMPILALCLFLHATQGAETAENRRAKDELWEWDGLSMGLTLKQAFGAKRPLVAVDTAGALPFWSELPSLDMLGLNDRHIALNKPADFGKQFIGHELGDGKYVLSRKPDLVVFQSPAGLPDPYYRSGFELVRSKEFQQTYQLIRVLSTIESRVVGEMWARRERGKLAVVRSPDRIEVPGYFVTGQASAARASLDRTGVLVADLSAKKPGVVPNLPIPAGRWRLETSPSDASLVFDVRCHDVSMPRGLQAAARVFESDGVTPLSIAVAPEIGARMLRLRSITLERVADAPLALRCPRPDAPLRVSAALLEREKAKKTPAAHPSNVAFAKGGLIVDMGTRGAVQRVDLSLSQNDAYLLELRRDGRVVWTTNVEKKRRRTKPTGLALYRFDLPKPIDGGNFEVAVLPRQGAEASSVGHVLLR